MQQIAEWEAEARPELEHREFSLGRYYALYNSDSAPVGAFSRAPLAQLDVVAIPVKMTAEAVAVKEVVVAAELAILPLHPTSGLRGFLRLARLRRHLPPSVLGRRQAPLLLAVGCPQHVGV